MKRHFNAGQTCIIDGCDKPMRARRWCTMHYHRWRSYGDPEYVTRPHRLDGAICDIDGCEKVAISKGWCKAHYSRHWKNGTTDRISDRTTDPEERFGLSTEWRGDCLEWTGAKTPAGYGALRVNDATAYAHRYAWERINGPIPGDKMIDHACHNRACVNVEHLRLASASQNAWNKRGAASNSRTGIRHVSMTPHGSYYVQIHTGGRSYYLHGYRTPEAAQAAAEDLRAELFGEFAGRS